MKTLKEYSNNFNNHHLNSDGDWDIDQSDAYKQGFIDAIKFALENMEVIHIKENAFADKYVIVDVESILKAIE